MNGCVVQFIDLKNIVVGVVIQEIFTCTLDFASPDEH
jgi:hypothetical protein